MFRWELLGVRTLASGAGIVLRPRRVMSSSASEARDTAGGRLGGARADFVASLGRKLNDARDLLSGLEDDPSSKVARDELRRRLHALGSGARLLRFEAMARGLQEVLAVLDRGAQAGGLREPEVAFIGEVLDDLPALAWGEAPPREAAPTVTEELEQLPEDRVGAPHEGPGLAPIAVLVVGGESLADALTEEAAIRVRAFECERTEDAPSALQLARAYAPDLVLVDSDHEGVPALVEALLDDPMTEPVPVVVVGAFRTPEEESRFIALGVARTLTKPVTHAIIRQVCDEILDAREGRTIRMTLGEPTLEQLAERLSQELKGALLEGVDVTARTSRVPLGEGTEVLGALWGAIARVQEIVTQRTKGAVRFGGDAPEGAIALAPWLHHDVAASDRSAARGRGAGADVRLNGRRVVVADDDPGVTWFIADLLRTAGCEVHEALDGLTARDIAFRVQPELVVSDILMPGLDGFALCRALRRDVALRDTPVMLLSWKEDLLQRVRELGASAAAYMRKESDSRAVLARVREVLRPRARIEARLRGDGEVRGRLDDLSPRLLLELVGAIRKDARVAVRDATFLYEIDIRGGAPRKATRTASDGAYQSGERALAMLLAVGAGRFVVSSSSEPIRGELSGTLFDLLARPIAAARGALAATTGAHTMEVERIVLDATVLEEYLRATPDPARAVLKRVAGGASPREMLLAGEVSPNLLEDVLTDLAARCAIRGVHGTGGVDLLGPAVAQAFTVLTGDAPPHRSAPPPPRSAPPPRANLPAPPPPAPPPPTPPPRQQHETSFASDPPGANEPSFAAGLSFESAFESGPPRAREPSASPDKARASTSQLRTSPARPSAPRLEVIDSEPPPSLQLIHDDDDDSDAPSSLEAAVMREISDRSPAPTGVQGGVQGGVDRPPIVEPSALRPRSSNPPAIGKEPSESLDEPPLPSIPPDAIVPAATSNEEFAVAAAIAGDAEVPAPADALVDGAPEPAVAETTVAEPPEPAVADVPRPADAEAAAALRIPLSLPPEDLHEVPDEPVAGAKSSRWGFVFGLALLVAAVGGILRVTGRQSEAPRPAPAPSAAPSATAVASTASTAASSAAEGATDDLPPGTAVPAGYGVLEIAVPDDARVRVDGAEAGHGPVASSVLRAGYHQVRIDQGDRNSQYVIEVRAGKTTHVKSAPLP
jgi:DNA-binding response OmpR family regulator